MSESTDTEKDIFKHAKGTFSRLSTTNYTTWNRNMRRLLRSLMAWSIIDEGEEMPPDAPANAPSTTRREHETRQREYIQRTEDAATAIYNACSSDVRPYIDHLDNPADMWRILRERLDTAASSTGRQALYQAFTNLRPVPGKPIGDYFAELLRIRNEIAGTDEAIPDVAFRTHIYNTIPPIFEMTGRIMACQPNLTAEQLIDALKEDERLRTLRTNHPATTDAYTASTNKSNNALTSTQGRGGGRGYAHGRGRGGYRSQEDPGRWCTFCETRTHTTAACFRKPASTGSAGSAPRYTNLKRPLENENIECYHCGEDGHLSYNCPVKARADAKRRMRLTQLSSNMNTTNIEPKNEEEGLGHPSF